MSLIGDWHDCFFMLHDCHLAYCFFRGISYLFGEMRLNARTSGLLFLWLWLANLPAQTPSYLHYGVQEGLPSNLVYRGIQDHRDLLWFGTDKGLVCFDGTRFRIIGVKEGLPDPETLNLMEDSQERLWISIYQKKPCYRKNGRFYTIQEDSLLRKMPVESGLWEFYEDNDQRIWICGANAVSHFTASMVDTLQLREPITRVARIDDALFFFGGASIFRQEPGTGIIKTVYKFDFYPWRDTTPVLGVSVSGQRVLYSFQDRLVLLEWRDGILHKMDERSAPSGQTFTDRAGRFWICSLAEGAFCFGNGRFGLSSPKQYLKGKKVTSMFEDRQGTYWFCTMDDGIYAILRNTAVSFSEQNGLASSNITSIIRGPDGYLWAGDDEGNLYQFDRSGKFQITQYGSYDGYNRIRQILPVPDDGGFWIVADEGLYFEKKNQPRQKFNIPGSPKSALLQSDKLWLVSSYSLGYLIPGETGERHLRPRRFTTLCADSDSNVWAGDNGGLYSQRDSFSFDWGNSFSALSSRIVAIQNAGKDSLWVVTPKNGLLLARVSKSQIVGLTIVNEEIKIPIENIQSLFQQPDGPLWLATNKGVYGLNKNWSVMHFDRHDGLADNDVNAVFVHGDTLWAATVGGLSRLVLKPAGAKGDFSTFITRVRYRLDDRVSQFYLLDSFPANREIVLPPNASLFEIELAGLDYRSRGNLNYQRVMTAGLPEWHCWTFDNLLTWAANGFKEKPDTSWVSGGTLGFGLKMPPGCYEVKVTAVTIGGLYSTMPDGLTVVMRPFWYNTIWFWLLLWGVFFFALWRFLNVRRKYRKLDKAVSELQLQALQAQMNPHFVGNSINAIQQFFYPPDPVRASEYIALFTRLLRRTMLFSEQTFISFEEELAYDRDYLEMMKLRFGDRFHYEITGAEEVPPETPFPSMLLQPVLENATMHGLAPEGDSVLYLQFYLTGKKLICTVTDNGVGFHEARERQKASGNDRISKGLEMLQQKVQTLDRHFDCGLQLGLQDLSDTVPPMRGSRVVIQFFPEKVTPTVGRLHENNQR